MARFGPLFGGRTQAADRDGDGVDDRSETTRRDVTTGRVGTTERKVDTTERKVDRDRDGIDDRAEKTERAETTERRTATTYRGGDAVERTTTIPAVAPTERTALQRSIDRETPTVPDVVAPVRPARVSLTATLGVLLGVAGVAVALTGLLAPWAIPIGALGLLFSFVGIVAGAARANVAGRGLGMLGVLISGTAVVFAVLAMMHQASWLDSNVDQVARLNEWLDAQLPWTKDW